MSVIKKRRGKTILFRWQVTTDGENIPFDDRDLIIKIVDPAGNARKVDFTFEEGTNVAEFYFQGKDQQRNGYYNIEMWENLGQDGQTVVDKVEAFCLVEHTEDEGEG